MKRTPDPGYKRFMLVLLAMVVVGLFGAAVVDKVEFVISGVE